MTDFDDAWLDRLLPRDLGESKKAQEILGDVVNMLTQGLTRLAYRADLRKWGLEHEGQEPSPKDLRAIRACGSTFRVSLQRCDGGWFLYVYRNQLLEISYGLRMSDGSPLLLTAVSAGEPGRERRLNLGNGARLAAENLLTLIASRPDIMRILGV